MSSRVLSSGVTVTINGELRVGALEETVTVSGKSSIVDVHDTRQQTTMTRDIIDSTPAAKSLQSLSVLVAGLIAATATAPIVQDAGGPIRSIAGIDRPRRRPFRAHVQVRNAPRLITQRIVHHPRVSHGFK